MRTPFIPPKGNNAANLALTGYEAEITVNTETKTIHVHDAVTPGGTPLATAVHTHAMSDITGLLPVLNDFIDTSQIGSANGVAGLDSTGLVPTSQLPSYVDDVLEYANVAALPGTGESGKIYITIDTTPAKQWRWTGTVYSEMVASPGTTDAVPEGAVNLYFTPARASAAAPVQTVAGRTGAVVLSTSDISGLATVATSGSYNDLSNKPSFSTVATSGQYADLLGKPALSAVATSGLYSDLSGKPTLATVATSGAYADLSGLPTLGTAASRNAPASGDATITQVVLGDDSRLTNSRPANGGNAATATALQTARTINGVSFDGTANITVAAAASTLTGSALPAGVTSSSLTSVGTLSSMTTSGNATAAAFIPTGSAVPTNGMYLSAANTLAWSTNSANRLTLNASGDLTATGDVTAYSDERLKENWEDLPEDFLNALASVKSGTYDRIDTHERQVGVSAQSLRPVLPEAVLEHEDGTLSVSYGNASLAASILLAREVLSLQDQVASLRDLIARHWNK